MQSCPTHCRRSCCSGASSYGTPYSTLGSSLPSPLLHRRGRCIVRRSPVVLLWVSPFRFPTPTLDDGRRHVREAWVACHVCSLVIGLSFVCDLGVHVEGAVAMTPTDPLCWSTTEVASSHVQSINKVIDVSDDDFEGLYEVASFREAAQEAVPILISLFVSFRPFRAFPHSSRHSFPRLRISPPSGWRSSKCV